MAVSVKNKIRAGTLFLFLMLTLVSAVSIYYLQQMQVNARNIIKDNYQSLSYGHVMLESLDSLEFDSTRAIARFSRALQLEREDITEPGEGQTADSLLQAFNRMRAGDSSSSSRRLIRSRIQRILALNMKAIRRKNALAEHSANRGFAIIITVSTFILLVAFSFVFNFPGIVVGPIEAFMEAIQQIRNRNYAHRIHLDTRDEFGQLAAAFNEMARQLEYFESSNLNQLMQEKARAEAVINSLQDPSIGLDNHQSILFANDKALELLGLKSQQVLGCPAEELRKKNELFDFLLRQQGTTPFKVVLNGRENYFIREVLDVPQGEAHNTVIILRNITSFKELDIAKTLFIATISHELKTPLAASDLSLKLLEDKRIGQLSGEQLELIGQLKANNRRMLQILSELLNVSQVEAGKIQLDVLEVDPASILAAAAEAVQSVAASKGVSVVSNIPPDLPRVQADANKTGWVLNNFLINAIQHSPSGNRVELGAYVQDGLVIYVRDQGPGIAAEHVPHVFERFFRVPGTSPSGTGLGLAISKELIETQGGRIWLESEQGAGSTFYFSVPLATSTSLN